MSSIITTLGFLIVSIIACNAAYNPLQVDPFSQAKFQILGCKGEYDKSLMAKLDHICTDCQHFHSDFPAYKICTEKCFSTNGFPACLQSLTYHGRQEEYRKVVEKLNGKGFDIIAPCASCKATDV